MQNHWPNTEITWIIGKSEFQLVKAIKDVNFIVFDKSAGLSGYLELRKQVRQLHQGRGFEVLLHMQQSIRASVASLMIPADIKLGFDRARAKDMQSYFCTHQITPLSARQHVVDSFLEFPLFFGLGPVKAWQLPVSAAALDSVKKKLAADRKIFVINPCAVAKSRNWRNWTSEGYAAIADHVSQQHDMQVVLSGGHSELEKNTADEILALCRNSQPISLVAKTSIDELVALLHLAEIVLAPDTGPVHIASAVGTKTIGLYASTNPDRAGPYNHRQYVVNRYPQALLKYNNKTVEAAPWGERVKTAECMKLITVNDVIQQIENVLAAST